MDPARHRVHRHASGGGTVSAMQQDTSIDDGRLRITSGTPWEATVGYSRALRTGPFVYVTGTMAADESGAIVHPDDAGKQAAYVFEKIRRALEAAGSGMADVVRTRMYVTDINDQAAIGAAHAAVFAHIRPCATMVQVGPLAAPEAKVEIEVDAVVGES
jgi:enamine deaminase RidA (YjgF/YER057c/UK114 family)